MANHGWFFIVAVAIGLLTGALLGAQPSANGFLGRHVAHPLQASTISFASGTALLVLVTLAMGHFPPKFTVPVSSLPWWAWIGGAIGTVMVTSSLFFVPKIGSLVWFAVVITGQIVAALILDHFGWLGNPKQAPSPLRLIGASLLVLGIVCITYSREPAVVKQLGVSAGDDGQPATSSEAQDAVQQLAEHLAEES
ncbi:DMT family transporter [Planctomycetaceae bacterium SH139]